MKKVGFEYPRAQGGFSRSIQNQNKHNIFFNTWFRMPASPRRVQPQRSTGPINLCWGFLRGSMEGALFASAATCDGHATVVPAWPRPMCTVLPAHAASSPSKQHIVLKNWSGATYAPNSQKLQPSKNNTHRHRQVSPLYIYTSFILPIKQG